jgi:hypothetical protein
MSEASKERVRWALRGSVALWLLYVTWWSAPTQTCIAVQQNKEAEQLAKTLPSNIPHFLVVGARISWCAGRSLYDDRDAVLIVATVILAIYTARLWTATKEMASDAARVAKQQAADTQTALAHAKTAADAATAAAIAGKASADAIPTIERAYVFFDHAATAPLNTPRLEIPIIKPKATRQIVFRNYGKTPGIFRGMASQFRYWSIEPEPIPASDWKLAPTVVVSAGEALAPFPCILEATKDEIAEAALGRGGGLFLTTRLDYEDIFEGKHETATCWQFDVVKGIFILFEGTHRLNYRT